MARITINEPLYGRKLFRDRRNRMITVQLKEAKKPMIEQLDLEIHIRKERENEN